MPLYVNPDFMRLPAIPTTILDRAAKSSFFALPAWYDLIARHGTDPGTEVRLYTDESAASMLGLCLQAAVGSDRRLISLANPYSVEHGVLAGPGADLASGLHRIITEILTERPPWDCLSLIEFDPSQPGYTALVQVLRQAGFIVECVPQSGTWYEDTTDLTFAEYLAARPSQLRNTYERKRRALKKTARLKQAFFPGPNDLDQLISDYQIVYSESWKHPENFPTLVPGLIRIAAKINALRLGIYYVDDIPAAAQFWIVWKGRAVIYKLAHDARFDRLSIGTLLTMEMMRRVLTTDRPIEINFGRGDDAYKRLWLTQRRQRWGITAANLRTHRGMRLGLRLELAKAYRWLQGTSLRPDGMYPLSP